MKQSGSVRDFVAGLAAGVWLRTLNGTMLAGREKKSAVGAVGGMTRRARVMVLAFVFGSLLLAAVGATARWPDSITQAVPPLPVVATMLVGVALFVQALRSARGPYAGRDFRVATSGMIYLTLFLFWKTRIFSFAPAWTLAVFLVAPLLLVFWPRAWDTGDSTDREAA